jgi:hypothetical protein
LVLKNLLFLVCLCVGAAGSDTVIIHDIVYDDYFTGSVWTPETAKAKRWQRTEAQRWLDDFRINERGEYANTGAKDYPVKIERAPLKAKERRIK